MITLKNRTLLPVVESFMKYVREVTPEVAVNKFSNQGTSEQVEHWKGPPRAKTAFAFGATNTRG